KGGRHGAIAELSAKAAGGKPVEVKLAPCGSAEVRFVDDKGKPAQRPILLELLVKPGLSVFQSREENKPAAEAAILAHTLPIGGGKPALTTDKEGRMLIPALIPGATYRLKLAGNEIPLREQRYTEKDFTVESGKTTKVEVKVPAEK